MNTKLFLSQEDVAQRAMLLATRVASGTRIYGVPRGGVHVAYMMADYKPLKIVYDPAEAEVIVDDIIDSGATRARYPNKPFYALVDKTAGDPDHWYVFPWETVEEPEGGEDNVRRLLQAIGEDPGRGGLLETPHRVMKAWRFWASGYGQNPADILKVFEDGAEGCDEMVIVKDIPIYSQCEHHMAAIFGTATIAYIPDGKIVGLSKLSRLADCFARRLQVQERLTNQIADALQEHLQPKGVGVIIRARHMCMESRGVCQQGHHTITSALRGVLKDKPEARAEFMALA